MKSEVRLRIDQILRGEVPRGYKKTKAGILPIDWTIYLIKDCLERVEHPVSVQADKMYTQIGIRSHGKGLFYKEPVSGEALGKKAVFWIEPDCFVLNIVFAWEQAIGKTTQNEIGMIGSHRFPMYRSVDGKIDIDYLIEYLMTKRGKDILETASPGGAGRNRTLGQDRFMKSEIFLPTKLEQQKIAEIIKLQNQVIELNSQMIRQLELMKKACLRKMFPEHGNSVPEVRFPGFTAPWERRKVSDLLEERNEQAPESKEYPLMAFIANEGVAPKGERYDRGALVKDAENKLYKKTECGDFIYSSNNLETGSIGLNNYGNASISPVYSIFKPKGIADSDFIGRRFVRKDFINAMIKWRQGVMYGQWKIHESDFLKIEVAVPSLEEQRRIGAYFSEIDNLITLYKRKRDEEKQKKKALMQLLFSGIVRVTV